MKNFIVNTLTSILFKLTSPVNIMRIAKGKMEAQGYKVSIRRRA